MIGEHNIWQALRTGTDKRNGTVHGQLRHDKTAGDDVVPNSGDMRSNLYRRFHVTALLLMISESTDRSAILATLY